MFLGGEPFVEKMQLLIDGDKELSEIPSSQRRPTPKSIETFVSSSKNRNEAIVDAYLNGGYTLKEIGEYFDLHYSTISGIVKNHKSKTRPHCFHDPIVSIAPIAIQAERPPLVFIIKSTIKGAEAHLVVDPF